MSCSWPLPWTMALASKGPRRRPAYQLGPTIIIIIIIITTIGVVTFHYYDYCHCSCYWYLLFFTNDLEMKKWVKHELQNLLLRFLTFCSAGSSQAEAHQASSRGLPLEGCKQLGRVTLGMSAFLLSIWTLFVFRMMMMMQRRLR